MMRHIALAAVGLLSGWLGYELADREIPVTVLSKWAEPVVVQPGGTVGFHYQIKRWRSCQTTVNRFMFDSKLQRHVLESDLIFQAGILPIGEDDFVSSVGVPVAVAEGPATYRTINCYVCNFTHRLFPLCDTPRDIEFTVMWQ